VRGSAQAEGIQQRADADPSDQSLQLKGGKSLKEKRNYPKISVHGSNFNRMAMIHWFELLGLRNYQSFDG